MSAQVKVPKEVAALMKGTKYDILIDIPYMSRMATGEYPDTEALAPIYDWYLDNKDEYFQAVVNGYEVEETPEEKVLKQFNRPVGFFDKDNDTEEDIYRKGMAFVIKTLNLKIEGVNA